MLKRSNFWGATEKETRDLSGMDTWRVKRGGKRREMARLMDGCGDGRWAVGDGRWAA